MKKKIVIYCQLIWGVGHFFRTLEICRALSEYDVILVTGGSRIDFPLPAHVRNIQLPAIMTDRDYAYLYT
ncbi:MAG: glycosyl transferase, partial [Desulfobacterales bacterium]|nr:glycosyl transferase [Desulfobacterales bacterium]